MEGARSCFARRAAHGGRADSRICQAADAEIVEPFAGAGPEDWTAGAAARIGRMLRAERAASAAFDAADDGDSRAGGGRGAHRRGFAEARARRLWRRRTCWASRSSTGWAARMPWRRWPTEPRALPRVDKIVGPGNLYVTAAKRLVAFDCAIDMLAGPTEIVVTSERGRAADIASDLVAQAEHDPEALAIFVTTREELARAVIAETKMRSRENAVAREAFERNGVVIVAGSVARGAHDHEPACGRAPDGGCGERSGVGRECRIGVCGALVGAAHGRLHLRAESHAAYGRHGAGARRVERERFCETDHGAGVHGRRRARAGTEGCAAGRGRRA